MGDADAHDPAARPAAETAADVLGFWLAAGPDKWFAADPGFDAEVGVHLLPLHEAAAADRLSGWAGTAEGALALVLLLDQVPRNAFRGTRRAFASDPSALAVAEAALARGDDDPARLGRFADLARFFYLPLMHAEDPGRQARCADLYRRIGDADGLKYALMHQEIIDRFGRFPHRNPVLGRVMRPEEQAFLDAGGFKG
ncbi:DUF924 family protein [Xanthobacter sp. KR7-225]|uniref:DUF924 family protein n=1 Tax=Xanthobacter sp. KR7-225 TaxID=3156613 RepID=UPI0032B3C07F